MTQASAPENPIRLSRSLTLTHAVLYGLGVTVGAGIYVLIGAAAGLAGYATPLAFVLAAAILAPTGATIGEFASRFPVAAGEAAYVRAAFNSTRFALIAGLVTAAIAIISGSAIAVGSAGYIAVFLPINASVIIAVVVCSMGLIAAWGIKESITFAGLMTLIEIGGLLFIVAAGMVSGTAFSLPPETSPAPPPTFALSALLLASMLAVFAFVGFESLANVAEEVKNPKRNLPIAIFATLAITTVLYVLVVWVALTAVGPTDLSQSKAPLALVFSTLTGLSPLTMSAIAIVATLNGIIVQIIMASRIFYGLSRQGSLPHALSRVNPITHTPLLATMLTTAIILTLALAAPLQELALYSSRLLLVLFAVLNAGLIVLKTREPSPPDAFLVPIWVPWLGLITTVGFLAADATNAMITS